MIDELRVALIVGLAALFLGICCVLYFLTTGASRFAWIALAALVGSSAGLIIQLWFDLQGSSELSGFTTEYTIDAEVPWIRQWKYPQTLGDRYASEVLASVALSSSGADVFNGDHQKLVRDLMLFSLLA